MPGFSYDEAITARFPGVVGGVIHAAGVRDGAAPAELVAAFRAEQAAVRERLGDAPLSELPTLAAWRSVFRAFGVDPTQYRSAAEALLRRLAKQGELPSISMLVDLANLVSIRHALPVAVFDARSVSGDILVRFARGDEPWEDLGASQTDHPEAGEVVFVDAVDAVCARRWCWRQSRASATRDDTSEVLVTVEGHHSEAPDDVAAALGDLESLLARHASSARLRSGIVDAHHPVFG